MFIMTSDFFRDITTYVFLVGEKQENYKGT